MQWLPIRLGAVVWFVQSLVSTAAADPSSDAQQHIDEATLLHKQGKFTEAGLALATAYALAPKPELLYALGQVEVKLADCPRAIAFYRRFLATRPERDAAAAATEAIASCQTPTHSPLDLKQEVARRIAAATAFHERGEFAQARSELAFAYAIAPDPPLLFALGQVHVKLDQCDRAIPFYERFIAENTDPSSNADAQQAIEVCKNKPAVDAPKPPPVDETITAPPVAMVEPRSRFRDRLGIGLVAGGGLLGVAAIIAYRGALDDLAAADQATTYSEHLARRDDANGKRNVAVGLGVVAAGLVAGGIVRFARLPGDRPRAAVSVAPVRGGALVVWGGSL